MPDNEFADEIIGDVSVGGPMTEDRTEQTVNPMRRNPTKVGNVIDACEKSTNKVTYDYEH